MQANIGIDVIDFSVSRYFIDLKLLADIRQIPYKKFYEGIGQEQMSVSPPDEDAVVLGANAAKNVCDKTDINKIEMVLFATESSIDQAKAGGVFLHQLLGLPSKCRVLELKQACYAVTGALQLAISHVKANPLATVLVIGADIARYPLHSNAEATQGAGAVAMIVSANPRLMVLEDNAAFYTEDVMDFWRPNYSEEAFVDGKLSMQTYLKVLKHTFRQYTENNDKQFNDFNAFCFHVPFAKLAQKGQDALFQLNGIKDETIIDKYNGLLKDALYYPKTIGNSYTASMYISLVSLLENNNSDFSGQRIGFFSYGSGCVGEFFSGIIQPTYTAVVDKSRHHNLLTSRKALSYDEYKSFVTYKTPREPLVDIPNCGTKPFRYAKNESQKRIYEPA